MWSFRSWTISVGPAENYWLQDLCPAYWIFFLKKSGRLPLPSIWNDNSYLKICNPTTKLIEPPRPFTYIEYFVNNSWFRLKAFNVTFNYISHNIVAVSFIGGVNWRSRRKPLTCRNSLTNFIALFTSQTYCDIICTFSA